MTLNGVIAVILRYFTELGKPAFQYTTAPICGGIYTTVYCVQCRRKESSRSLSHLLMNFLSVLLLCFVATVMLNKDEYNRSRCSGFTRVGVTGGPSAPPPPL